jgi:hypothetical protein
MTGKILQKGDNLRQGQRVLLKDHIYTCIYKKICIGRVAPDCSNDGLDSPEGRQPKTGATGTLKRSYIYIYKKSA